MATMRQVLGSSFGNDAKLILGDMAIVNNDDRNADNIFLQEISKTNPIDDKERILASKGPFIYESFCWILEHPDFKTWRDTRNSGVFWIKGDPGKGKTMLICGIIDNLKNHSQLQEKFAYFFCQGTDTRINTATAVIKGLIYSVLRQNQRLLSQIRQQFEKEPKGQLEGPNAWVSLSRMFITIMQDPSMNDFICVVDALDECQHQESRKLLLNLIVDTSDRIKWLVSSRNEKEIEQGLKSIQSHQRLMLELKGNAGHISEAVDIYINRCVQDIEALDGNPILRDRTINSLKTNANGTFLWVTLVVQQLRNASHLHIEGILERMPKDLQNLYDEIMTRSKKAWREDEEACLALLATVAAAERPLRVDELYIFINTQLANNSITYHSDDIRYLAKACGSFISIIDDTIYFIHQSVKDYLVKNGALSIFPRGIEYQHSRMFEFSLDAMNKILRRNIYNIGSPGKHVDDVAPPEPNPLASREYCCSFWVQHLAYSCESREFRNQEYLRDGGLLHSFLQRKYLYWLEAMVLLKQAPQAAVAIQKLRDLIATYCKDGDDSVRVIISPKPGKIGNAGYMRRLLNALTPKTESKMLMKKRTNEMLELTSDLYRLVVANWATIEVYPLQIYASALIFSPSESMLRKLFETTQCPKWIITKPKMLSNWSPCMQIIEGHTSTITSITCSPNNAMLATGSIDRTVKIWDLTSGACLHSLECNKRRGSYLYPLQVVFSPNSTKLVWITDEEVEIWDPITGTRLKTIDGCFDSASVSTDGALLALMDRKTVTIHDFATNNDIQAYSRRSSEMFLEVIFPSNRARLESTFSGSGMRPRNSGSHMHRSALTDRVFHAILLASAQDTSSFNILDLATGKCTRSITVDMPDNWQRDTVRISSDGMRLAIRSGKMHTITIWDLTTGECLQTIGGQHPNEVRQMAFSPDGMQLASTNRNDVKVWDVTTGTCLRIFRGHKDYVHSLAYSPDGLRLISGSGDDTARVWDMTSDTSSQRPNTYWSSKDRIEKMTYSPDCSQLSSFSVDETLRIWDPATGVCLQALRRSNKYFRPVYSSDGMQLVTVSRPNCDILIWNPTTGTLLRRLRGHKRRIYSIASSQSGTQLASVSRDELKIWDLIARKCLHNIKINEDFNSTIAFSSDGTQLGYVSDKGDVKIWDTSTGACLQTKEPARERGVLNENIDNESRAERVAKLFTHFSHEPQEYCGSGMPELELSKDAAWILRQQEPVLWLPPDYRPVEFEAYKNSFAIVSNSNQLLCFQFSLDILDAEIKGHQ